MIGVGFNLTIVKKTHSALGIIIKFDATTYAAESIYPAAIFYFLFS